MASSCEATSEEDKCLVSPVTKLVLHNVPEKFGCVEQFADGLCVLSAFLMKQTKIENSTDDES